MVHQSEAYTECFFLQAAIYHVKLQASVLCQGSRKHGTKPEYQTGYLREA
jgi:hypothetical protein